MHTREAQRCTVLVFLVGHTVTLLIPGIMYMGIFFKHFAPILCLSVLVIYRIYPVVIELRKSEGDVITDINCTMTTLK